MSPSATAAAGSATDTQQLRKALSKYALPSASELRHLHAADPSSSYRASFFRLQVDELLAAVAQRPSEKAATGIQALLFELKGAVAALPPQQVTQEALQARGLRLRNHVKRKEIVLPFRAPARLDVLGSFILKTMAFARKSTTYGVLTVDVAFEMPAACFLPKDFANYRYADKRSLYLGVLVAELQARQDLFSSVALAGWNGDYEKPVAVLHVSAARLAELGVKSTRMCIRLIPGITTDVFKLSKLAPSRNNIRHDPGMTEAEMRQCRTPHYNNAVLEDMMMRQHTRELHAALAEAPQLAEACVLAKVWLRQRGFHEAHDSLNGFLVSMLLLYLFLKQRVSAQTPSDQMFKVLVQFLASHKLEDEPLQFPPAAATGGVVLTSEGLAAFRDAFELVVLDSSGRLNLFARVSRSAWAELQHCARDSVQRLQTSSMDDFRALFIERRAFWTRYDQFFWFPAPAPVDDADDETYSVDEKRAINDMGLERFWSRKLGAVLAQALTDRVTLVRPVLSRAVEWPLHGDALPPRRKVAVGLRLDPDTAGRIVDKGPAADDAAASRAFRAFWKTKAELRRFKDGAIVEAVVWDEVSADRKHQVVDAIVRFIAAAHAPQLARAPSQIKNSNASLYAALDVEEVPSVALATKSTVLSGSSFESTMNAAAKLWVVFNGFAKTLRGLDSLPLQVLDVLPIHAGFRGTSLFPVQPHPLAFSKREQAAAAPAAHVSTVLEPLVLHLQFERSSSWPSEPAALRHAKTGFYVLLAHELETRKQLRCEVARDGVDVFTGGYVFRLLVQSERELGLASGSSSGSTKHSLAYIAAKQETTYAAAHANTLHALHGKHAAFAPTVRLAQRWLADKFLSNALRVEAVELLVAHTFVTASASATPHSVLSGLLRFLQLLARHDWQRAPLAVAVNGGLDDAQRREVAKRFDASRSNAASHPAMFIAADYEDMDCLSSWTRVAPAGAVVVARLAALAQTAYDALVHWLEAGAATTGWKPAFASSTAEFDAVLTLAAEQLPAKKMRLEASRKQAFAAPVYKNMNLAAVPVMVGFDPAQQLLDELTAAFGHLALFFFNGVERRAIALSWKPQAFLPAKFRAVTSHLLAPLPAARGDGDDGARTLAVPNVFEVLAEIRRMGGGMIRAVALQPSHAA
ncbi:hypothetical protein PybrP1_001999 [[Pythium] brassicae (nom. inval.)]|nr:hypothetical protein PybrP1_001999 [[Pythium] brassicae (nom. inval.)]